MCMSEKKKHRVRERESVWVRVIERKRQRDSVCVFVYGCVYVCVRAQECNLKRQVRAKAY